MKWQYTLLLLFFILKSTYSSNNDGKLVITSLVAQWNHTSFIAEIAEFIGKEDPTLFFKYIDLLTEKNDINIDNLEKEYEVGIKLAGEILSESRLDLLKLSLSLRVASPAIELFQKLGKEKIDGKNCIAFVEIGDKFICSANELEEIFTNGNNLNAETYSIDHIFYSKKIRNNEIIGTIILYGNYASKEFGQLYNICKKASKNGKINFAVRFYDSQEKPDAMPVSLSGYGVELSIKNTEYKAIDDSNEKKDNFEDDLPELNDVQGFNFNILKKKHVDLVEQLKQLKVFLAESDELTPLKQWEVQDISFQAAQKVFNEPNAEAAIETLVDISQNFPIRARSISQVAVDPKLRKEVQENQERLNDEFEISPGENSIFINGINIDADSLDIYSLLDTLKQEETLANSFYEMGFRREYLSLLFSLDFSESKESFAVDFREAFPEYINNLDKDPEYKRMGNSVKLMLQPYFPGMIRPIARNFFNLIFVVDPGKVDQIVLLKIAHSFYSHQIPLRIGIIFDVSNEDDVNGMNDIGVAVVNFYNYAKSEKNAAKALNLCMKMFDSLMDDLTIENIHKFFKKNFKDVEIDEVFGKDSDYNQGRATGRSWIIRSGLGKSPKVLLNGVVFDQSSLSADKIEEAVMNEVSKQTPYIQKAVMNGKLTDKDNVMNWIMSRPTVLSRLNNRILNNGGEYLKMTNVMPCKVKNVNEFNKLSDVEKTQCIITKMKYFTRSDVESTKPLTIWLVGDMEQFESREMLRNALKFLKKSKFSRIGLINNPKDGMKNFGKVTKIINSIIRLLPQNIIKQILPKILAESVIKKIENDQFSIDEFAVNGMSTDNFNKEAKLLSNEQLKFEVSYAKSVLNLNHGDRKYIVNGKSYGTLEEKEIVEVDDFDLLEKMAISKGANKVASQIDRWGVEKDNGKSSDVVMRSISVIGNSNTKKTRHWVVLANDQKSVVHSISQDDKKAVLDIIVVTDPLTKGAQKLSAILKLILRSCNADLKIVLNPQDKLSELPLKRFYRFVADQEISFTTDGKVISPVAVFENLPKKQLLTLNVISPDSWMIQPIFAEYDLDNIKMESVEKNIVAKFELRNILLEGHCFDDITGSPPRGLQFELSNYNRKIKYDTIVMANLGYFQLKANPGIWNLELRQGRSEEVYNIVEHKNTESQNGSIVKVMVDSLPGRVIKIKVSKKADKLEENLLSDDKDSYEDDDDEENSIWSSVTKYVSGEKYDEINIFSLASGHMYERLMRIMMVSVMKHTKHPVKFWLLNNYVSPQFRNSLEPMAKKYGFSYELVEYKWPRWLHKQTEKQRIMWGYKILFLDVLFPLHVKKIIFVDADQIVRTDLMELMNFDLNGAPYGYTPFCDNKKEMDGFRFWKTGYWANHLAGRRYHISALYVVDLVKFRKIAAGDRLRGQYQGLSADPNSLANLDQDLPNNMIHQVKIKSLPQEWLWCETWCDEKSKKNAKTIDLCNNPLTKEPKLDAARRIVPEWIEYDEEIRELLEKNKISNLVKENEDKNKNTHSEL
ncbi:UDP-glucose:glycoprotein glucosyltransferase 1 [Strongyloides ratti]|uniref:UDP-glucose:glycoprotein glucosyltransferase 1 n=1 Tax=Strongyloides ratti TaxID=34506 RepID=A0A090L025_STRRB|nr:UDP-glucose:glycoprotein glucosyltransferase 1 [Strongyloides ratti]CEF63031.1 UDP-glucose:glycoprotein glucosyltransferase 1 [Strongyloides ratti]